MLYDGFPKIKNERVFSHYKQFIDSRLDRTLLEENVETHHILPRVFGGQEGENLIDLTPKEHYVVHHMLQLAFGGKMSQAFWLMSHSRDLKFKLSANEYTILKKEQGVMNSLNRTGKVWVSKDKKNKIIDPKHVNRFIEKGYSLIAYKPEEFRKKSSVRLKAILQRHKEENYCWIHKGEDSKYIPEKDLDDFLNKGWSIGFQKSRKTSDGKRWMRCEGQADEQVSEENVEQHLLKGWEFGRTSFGKGLKLIKKDETIKKVPPEELDSFLSEGWSKYSPAEDRLPEKCITRNGVNKRVSVEELNSYLEKGWTLGVKHKTEKKRWMSSGKEVKQIPLSEVDFFLKEGWCFGRKLSNY